MALVTLVREDGRAREATGATLYGAVRGRWPVVWDDIVQIDERVRLMERRAEMQALRRK
jgi:hypothetical protein